MRRQQQQSRQVSSDDSKKKRDDEIWGELSGGSSDGEEDENDDGDDVAVGREGRELHKLRDKAFDDVLWQGQGRGGRGARRGAGGSLEETKTKRRGDTNVVFEDETYTKLIAFSEAVKKISLLLRKKSARGDEELQTERLVARRLCREVEVELKQLQPQGGRRRGGGGGEDEDNSEECGRRYRRLNGEFEKMKQRFEEIDDALRRREKESSGSSKGSAAASRPQKPSTSIFGELNVLDDYDAPSSPSSSSSPSSNGVDRKDRKSSDSGNGGVGSSPGKSTQAQRKERCAGSSEASESKRASTTTRSVARNRKPAGGREADSDEDEERRPGAAGSSGSVQLQKQARRAVDTDKSLQTLQGDLEQLLTLFQDFNELVHAQQPMIDQFEERVLAAEEQTKSAVTELATGASYGAYGLPLVGAAVGGILFGPLGAIAGAKGMAAVGVCVMGGMGVGAYVGRRISAKQKQEAALILERYRQRQSQLHEREQDGGLELQRLRPSSRHHRRTDDVDEDDDKEYDDDDGADEDDDDEYDR